MVISRCVIAEKPTLFCRQVMLSLLMILMGFIVYYLMPFSFIFQHIPLFLFLLTIILLGMLVGLSMVAQIVQPWAEKGVFQTDDS